MFKKEITKIIYLKKSFRFSNESDSYSAANKEDLTDTQDDSNNNLDSVTQVQDYVLKLNSSIAGMKEKFNLYFE
jgi:hypothetical protein